MLIGSQGRRAHFEKGPSFVLSLDADTALVEFTDNEVVETKEISGSIYADLDEQGNLVSMTVEHARINASLQEFSYIRQSPVYFRGKPTLRGTFVKNTVLTFLGIELCLLCVASLLFSAPVPAVGPVDVEGTVLRADWLPEKSVKGIPHMSGSAGHDRTIPARFMVCLKDYSGLDANAFQRMKAFYRWSASDNLNSSGMPEFIVLQLPHQDKALIKEGMRVRVRGYVLRGDEGSDWTLYKEIQILRTGSDRAK